MSVDYDRLFHSAGPADGECASSETEGAAPAATPPMPIHAFAPRRQRSPCPMPIAPTQTQTSGVPAPREAEITQQMRPAQHSGPQRAQNGMLRTPPPAPARRRPARSSSGPRRAARVPPPPRSSASISPRRPNRCGREPNRPGPAGADLGRHHGQPPSHRRPVARRGAHCGQDVVQRLAALAVPVHLGSTSGCRPTRSTMTPHARIRRNARTPTRSASSGRRAPARPLSRWRSVRRSAGCAATVSSRSTQTPTAVTPPTGLPAVGGHDLGSVVRQGIVALQRYPRVHQHERCQSEVLGPRGIQRGPARIQRRLKGAVGIVSRYYNLVLADCGAGLFQPARC